MSDLPRITIMIRAAETNRVYFRDALASITEQTFSNFELYLLDENPSDELRQIAEEFFPGDPRMHYLRMRKKCGLAETYNNGMRLAAGEYFLFFGQHDRLAPTALSVIASHIADDPSCDVIYTDYDELDGTSRVEPHFLSDLNVELLLRTNYIGDYITISRRCVRRIGLLCEGLLFAAVYEYLLRCVETKTRISHLAMLLYHIRRPDSAETEELTYRDRQKISRKKYREYEHVTEASLRKKGIPATVKTASSGVRKIEYPVPDRAMLREQALILHDSDVKVYGRHAVQRLSAILAQKDVAIVGCRFLGTAFSIDNCGYIFDQNGFTYPACYGQSFFSTGYDGRAVIPRDVSMVDFGFCLIDRKFFRKSGGLDKELSGRDMMLDLCLKAHSHGMRIVYEPGVVARRAERELKSSAESHERLCTRWEKQLKKGDPYYNRNLPMGLENYSLY